MNQNWECLMFEQMVISSSRKTLMAFVKFQQIEEPQETLKMNTSRLYQM